MEVRRYSSAEGFLRRIEQAFADREIENNFILARAGNPGAELDTSAHLVTVDVSARTVLAALLTPLVDLAISEGPEEALEAVAAHLADSGSIVSGALGPETEVQHFLKVWITLRAGTAFSRMQSNLYAARSISLPQHCAEGRMRQACGDDLDLLTTWVAAFGADAHLPPKEQDISVAARQAERRVKGKSLFLWERQGEPVGMAGFTPVGARGARINLVYTPPEHRGQGIAGTMTAELARHLLTSGRNWIALFADTDNPITNKIYPRIGFAYLCRYLHIGFGEADP